MNPTPIISGVVLTNLLREYYRVPVNDQTIKRMVVTNVRFLNHDSVTRTVTVHFIEPGNTATTANARFKTYPIEPTASGAPPAYFSFDDPLLPGSTIAAYAEVSGQIVMIVAGASYP